MVAKVERSKLRPYKDVLLMHAEAMGPSRFFVSVADKGVSVAISGLESTVAGWVCKC